jgi:endonuclease III
MNERSAPRSKEASDGSSSGDAGRLRGRSSNIGLIQAGTPVPLRKKQASASRRKWNDGNRKRLLRQATEILVREYGLPTHGNKSDPLDELVYIVLSSQTDETKYQAAHGALVREFPSLAAISLEDEDRIEQLIRPAGLSRVKARNLVCILTQVERDLGERSLNALYEWDDGRAEAYLCSLPGVGIKSARCVLMYSLGRRVMPIDTHNFRVLQRLGAHDLPLPVRRWHDAVQEMIPADIRHPLHVTLVAHGREVCKAAKPRCDVCPLRHICRFER